MSARLARPALVRRSAVAVVAIVTVALASLGAAPAVADPAPLHSISLPGSGLERVAFTPNGRFAYVSERDLDSVAVIDVASSTPLSPITVGDEPYAVAVSPDGSQVYVSNYAADSVSIIDTATNTVVGSPIAVGVHPFAIVFSPDGSKAYVSNYGGNTVSVITVASRTVTGSITASRTQPQALAMSPDGSELWLTTGGSQGVVDVASTSTNTVLATVKLPGTDAGQAWAYDLAITPDGGTVFVGDVDSTKPNSFYAIDTSTRTIDPSREIEVPTYASAIDISPDGTTAYAVYGTFGGSETPLKNGVYLVDLATGARSAAIATGGNSTDVAVAPNGSFAYVVNQWTETITIVGEPVTRAAGADRIATAIQVSQQSYPANAKVVYVATGYNYPDALAAGPAAAAEGGPLLLTPGDTLPAAVAAEIQRLQPSKIVVVGGPAAVSNGVYDALDALAPEIHRAQGPDRFATSRAIAEYAFGTSGASHAYIATGLNFPDALSASAAGAASGSPVILVNGTASSVDAATVTLLNDLGVTDVTVVGGTAVISPGIKNQLAATRLSGADRYETSLAIAQDAYPSGASRVLIATGLNFPDALAGSAWAGPAKAPLLIVKTNCIPGSILDEIISLDPVQVSLIGSTGVLNESVFDLDVC